MINLTTLFLIYFWFILIFPWQYFAIPAVRVIEPSILVSFIFLVFIKKGRIQYDFFGKIYFAFIAISAVYTLGFPIFRTDDIFTFNHRFHLFLYTAEIFLLYLIVFNIFDTKHSKLEILIRSIFYVHIFVFAVLIYAGLQVQIGSITGNLRDPNYSAYSFQNDNMSNYYISNGLAWSFLLQNSILIGYYIKSKKETLLSDGKTILLIILPLIISYINMSRSAIIFSSAISFFSLLIIFKNVFSSQLTGLKLIFKTTIFLSLFFLSTFIILEQFKQENLIVRYISLSIGAKGDSSNPRIKLLEESIYYGLETNLIGGGIGHLGLKKRELNNKYDYLRTINPQNTFASIFTEHGIIGLLLFLTMLTVLILRVINHKRLLMLDNTELVTSMKFSLFVLLSSFMFFHFLDRSFSFLGIFIILSAIFNKTLIFNNTKIKKTEKII